MQNRARLNNAKHVGFASTPDISRQNFCPWVSASVNGSKTRVAISPLFHAADVQFLTLVCKNLIGLKARSCDSLG